MEHHYLQPLAVAIWTAVVLAVFVVVFACILDNLRRIRDYRRELAVKAERLRIRGMLARTGTTLSRYLRRTPAMHVELQLLRCESCERTDACDQYLGQGKDADPRTFCPNFSELATPERPCRRRLGPWTTSGQTSSPR